MIKMVLSKLKRLGLSIYSVTGRLFPAKDKNILLFGARNGNYYMDNSRALFEYFLENHPEIKIYWMARDKDLYEYLIAKGIPAFHIYSAKAFRIYAKSKFGFYTNRALDLFPDEDHIPKNIKLIFLGHGQSVKNSRLTVKKGISPKFKKDIFKTSQNVHKAVSSSEWMASIQSESQGLTSEKYLITGFPRNDWLLVPGEKHILKWNLFTKNEKFSKVILYAPTWRMHGEPTVLFPFDDFNANELAVFLEKQNLMMLLRPHLQELNQENNKKKINELMLLTNKVKLATNEEFPDANLLLPFIDVLISDYSSIYHDFLFLNKPMLFIPYDLQEFEEANGFKYPYLENLPGPAIYSQNEFIAFISELRGGKDNFIHQRDQLRAKIYKHMDAKSCERLANAVVN